MQGKLVSESETWTNIKFTLMIDPQNKHIANWKHYQPLNHFLQNWLTSMCQSNLTIYPLVPQIPRIMFCWDFPRETELTSSRYYARLSDLFSYHWRMSIGETLSMKYGIPTTFLDTFVISNDDLYYGNN